MGFPKALAAYDDIRAVFDKVKAANKFPATLKFPSKGKAINWRQRANAFRARLRQQDELSKGLPRGEGETPYDAFILSLSDTSISINIPTTEAILIIDGEETPYETGAEDDFGIGEI